MPYTSQSTPYGSANVGGSYNVRNFTPSTVISDYDEYLYRNSRRPSSTSSRYELADSRSGASAHSGGSSHYSRSTGGRTYGSGGSYHEYGSQPASASEHSSYSYVGSTSAQHGSSRSHRSYSPSTHHSSRSSSRRSSHGVIPIALEPSYETFVPSSSRGQGRSTAGLSTLRQVQASAPPNMQGYRGAGYVQAGPSTSFAQSQRREQYATFPESRFSASTRGGSRFEIKAAIKTSADKLKGLFSSKKR